MSYRHAEPWRKDALTLKAVLKQKAYEERAHKQLLKGERRLERGEEEGQPSAPPSEGGEDDELEGYGSDSSGNSRRSHRIAELDEEREAEERRRTDRLIWQALKAERARVKAARVEHDRKLRKRTRRRRKTVAERVAADEEKQDPLAAWILDPDHPARVDFFATWVKSAILDEIRIDDLTEAFFITLDALDEDEKAHLGETADWNARAQFGLDPFLLAALLEHLAQHLSQQRAAALLPPPPNPLDSTVPGSSPLSSLHDGESPFAHPPILRAVLSLSACGLLKDGQPWRQLLECYDDEWYDDDGPTEQHEHYKQELRAELLPGFVKILDDVLRWCGGPLKRLLHYRKTSRYPTKKVAISKEYLAFGTKVVDLTYTALAVDNIHVVVVDACGKDAQVATRTAFYGRLNCRSTSFLVRKLFGRRTHVNLREHSTIALRTTSPWLRALIFLRDISTIFAESEDLVGPVDQTLASMTPKSVLEHLKREYAKYNNEFPPRRRFERLIPFDDLIARIGGEPSTFAQARDRAHIVIASLTQSGRKWQVGAPSTPVKSFGPEGGNIFDLLRRRCIEERDGVPVTWASLDSTTQSSLIYYGAVDFDGPPPPDTVVSPKQLMSKYSLGIHARRAARLEAESITVKVNARALALAEHIFTPRVVGSDVGLDSLNVQLAACVTADIWHKYAGGSNEKATSSTGFDTRSPIKRVQPGATLVKFLHRSLPPHLRLHSFENGHKTGLIKRLPSKPVMLQPYGLSIGKFLGKNGYEMGFTNDLEGKFQGNPHQAQLARRIYEELLGEMERNEWPYEALVKTIYPASHDVARASLMLFAADIVQIRPILLPPVDPSDSSAMSVSSVGTDSTLSSVDELLAGDNVDEVMAAVDVERNDRPLERWLRTRPAATDEEEGEEDGYEGQDEGGGGTDIDDEITDDEIADDEAEEDEGEEDEAEEDSDESWEGSVTGWFSEASDEEQ